MKSMQELPGNITVFERGWLSSNNILFKGRDSAALVDSGYGTHAPQTVALVGHALAGRPLDLLVNTHLHSDHCGGNAALQRNYPGLRTLIPPGLADAVARWDADALTYEPTGQFCEPFRFDAVIRPGTQVLLGDKSWEVHAAPGHDPHSVILFEPSGRVLISADALWENGFGVVFPELEGTSAFDELGATLDLIESLQPRWVIPGHGSVFADDAIPRALETARSRLAGFVAAPAKHARHAAKVLLKFKLLELQQVPLVEMQAWAQASRYFELVHSSHFPDVEPRAWFQSLVSDLVKAGAATMEGESVRNV